MITFAYRKQIDINQLMKRIVIILCLLASAFDVSGQKLTVEKMEVADGDLTASVHQRLDKNGNPCGLVKVQLPADGAKFEGNVLGDVVYKTGEYWVYMSEGSYMLNIKHPNYHPLMVNFRDYNIRKVERKTTYVLTLQMPKIRVEVRHDTLVKEVTKEVLIPEKPKKSLVEQVEDMQTIGGMYNYGSHWPVGLSFSYSYSFLMVSLDAGLNMDDDNLVQNTLDMTDVYNFDRKDVELDPKFYMTLTPSFFMKYFSAGLGVGFMYMSGHQYESYCHANSTYSNEDKLSKVKFMLRPSVKGYVPLNDELYFTASVGYDYIFGYKEKNGLCFGVGLQWDLGL